MSEWRTDTLAELTSKIGSGATPRGGANVYLSSGIALIRSQNVLDNSMTRAGLVFLTSESARALDGVTVQEGDVLINITGDSIARTAVVDHGLLPARVNQHVAILRPGPGLDGRYLQRFLVNPQTKEFLLSIGSGATRSALTKAQLGNLSIRYPSLQEQRAIAEVLGALDDKIAANTKLAATSWELAESEYRAIPRPEVITMRVGELLSLEYGKSLPAAAREAGTVSVVGSGGIVGAHAQAVVESSGVVVGRKGTAGAVHWIDGAHWPIDTTYYVVPKRPEVSHIYAYFVLRALNLHEMNGDSAVPGLNRNEAHASRVLLPEAGDINAFSQAAERLVELASQSVRESVTLAATRDALLPQLMSGKLRVKDAERIAAEVA